VDLAETKLTGVINMKLILFIFCAVFTVSAGQATKVFWDAYNANRVYGQETKNVPIDPDTRWVASLSNWQKVIYDKLYNHLYGFLEGFSPSCYRECPWILEDRFGLNMCLYSKLNEFRHGSGTEYFTSAMYVYSINDKDWEFADQAICVIINTLTK
jgi:hypothetical protein